MTGPRSSDNAPQAALSLKDRFIAWWEGYDLSAILSRRLRDSDFGSVMDGSSAAAHGAVGNGRHLNRHNKPLWTASRIQVAEKIWGHGFATPGGTDHIPTLVKPLGLNPAMSVLDIGAGLGGSSRAMATQYGAWVTGLEYNPVLAEAGMFRSHKAGLARQAPISQFDPEHFTFNKRVDAIFSKEALYTVHNKDGLIDAIEACLKPKGQLLFTDYVIDNSRQRGRDFDGWAAHEPVEPHPWSVEQYSAALQQRNLDIRIAEDISDAQVTMIVTAIQQLVKHLETVAMDRETKLAVVEEVELWARRVAALSSGLRCYRFYAMKPADLS
ncbi:SAM-dependent methyltransferase [Indioceanicola profundi]|uniref:SAM-dependent methyltransferase n=1 Tax=Indioceanicola profundi TaxID=2220096 RepID=UPI000E6AAC48|nr:methyltransferase domain-containing protein [Indioceanicola profundi]